MIVSIAQINCSLNNRLENAKKMASFIEKSKKKNADVIVFPEMSDLGYDLENLADSATKNSQEQFLKILKNAAQKNKINVVAGIVESKNEEFHNLAIVIDSKGELKHRYQKIHLYTPAGEGIFTPGDKMVKFRINDFTAGLLICYDIRFPEMCRSLALEGVNLLIIPTAWPFPRLDHWKLLTRARAIENQCFVVAANRVGKDDSTFFCGNSRIIDPHGTILSSCSEDQEELIFARLDIKKLSFVRNRQKVFEHRKPTLYLVNKNEYNALSES